VTSQIFNREKKDFRTKRGSFTQKNGRPLDALGIAGGQFRRSVRDAGRPLLIWEGKPGFGGYFVSLGGDKEIEGGRREGKNPPKKKKRRAFSREDIPYRKWGTT